MCVLEGVRVRQKVEPNGVDRRFRSRDSARLDDVEWAEVRLESGAALLLDPADAPLPEVDEPVRGRRWLWPRRLSRATTSGAWFFVLLAAAALVLHIQSEIWYADAWDWLVYVGMYAVSLTAATLMPAAILVWRPNSIRSAWMLLVGAVLWTAPPAFSLLGSWALRHLQVDGVGFSQLMDSIPVVAELISLSGALLFLAGMEQVRERSRTTWPRPLVWIAVALTAATCTFQVHGILGLIDQIRASGGDYSGMNYLLLDSVAGPILALLVAGMAWSALSAARAGETPRSLWRLLAIGFTATLPQTLVASVQVVSFWGFGVNSMTLLDGIWLRPAAIAADLGIVLVTVAFVLAGLPDRDPIDDDWYTDADWLTDEGFESSDEHGDRQIGGYRSDLPEGRIIELQGR